MEMIMTAGMVSADEAQNWISKTSVPLQVELMEFCNGVAQKIMRNSPLAISKAIKSINAL
jgi:enoyl-CoA hydratase